MRFNGPLLVTFTMAAEPEKAILDTRRGVFVQIGEVVCEELPLCEIAGS